jgi:hypothetical protein
MMVNINLTNTASKGAIEWYAAIGAAAPTLKQTSPVLLVPQTGDVLTITLQCLSVSSYMVKYSINGGREFVDKYDIFIGKGSGTTSTFNMNGYNAAAFSFFNLGGGDSHSVGPLSLSVQQNKYPDLLAIGNSIMWGSAVSNPWNRMATALQKRYHCVVEVLAKPANSLADININEIGMFNAKKLFVLGSTNDLQISGLSTAQTRFNTFVTAVGAISNEAAPTGYSFANGNLIVATELPRAALGATIETFNNWLYTTCGAANMVDFHRHATDGTVTFSGKYSYDGTHPNDIFNNLMTEAAAKYCGFKKRDSYTGAELYPYLHPNGLFVDFGQTETALNVTNGGNWRVFSHGGYNSVSQSWTSTRAKAVRYGENESAGWFVSTNSSLSVGSTYTPTDRFLIDFNGNLVTGSTLSATYRTTNGGSDVSGHFVIDPSSSLTSGSAFTFDATNGFGFTQANATRRILGAGIRFVSTSSTAGSEAGDVVISTQSGGTALTEKLRVTSTGSIVIPSTITAVGTTTTQVINKPIGVVNAAAGATSVTVTNSLVTANSYVNAIVKVNDATAQVKNVVPGAGTFTINFVSAVTAETAVTFFVLN